MSIPCIAEGTMISLLLAFYMNAQILGGQSQILGGSSGVFRQLSSNTVSITTLPFERTVTCTGTYTLTGTASGSPASVSWSASPSGASGACTGTSSWSCAVAIAPDAIGEGVETITVTSNVGGSANVTIGFYVNGAHTCFSAQNINTTYNSSMSNGAAISHWDNVGSSAKDADQVTGAQMPTYITNCVGGQPCVRFDGGDRMYTSTIADWTFLSNGTDYTFSINFKTAADPNALLILASTQTAVAGTTRGMSIYYDDRVSFPAEDQIGFALGNGTATLSINSRSDDDAATGGDWHQVTTVLDDDAGALIDNSLEIDTGSVGGSLQGAAYSASAPAGQLVLGDEVSTRTFKFNGDVTAFLIYQSALTATQQEINRAVAGWEANGGISAKQVYAFVGDSITAGSGGVTPWATKIGTHVGSNVIIQNRGVSATRTTTHIAQWRAAGRPDKLFVLGGINDIALDSASAATVFANLTTIYQEAQSNGIGQVIGIAVLPFGDNVNWTAGRQTELEALNTSILASVDTDIEFDWYTLMQDPADLDALLPAYSQVDGLHPSDAGTTVMANNAISQLGL